MLQTQRRQECSGRDDSQVVVVLNPASYLKGGFFFFFFGLFASITNCFNERHIVFLIRRPYIRITKMRAGEMAQ